MCEDVHNSLTANQCGYVMWGFAQLLSRHPARLCHRQPVRLRHVAWTMTAGCAHYLAASYLGYVMWCEP
eukprot:g54934.t1